MTDLRSALDRELTDTAWLDMAVELVRKQPTGIGRLFPAVGRRCGRAAMADLDGWTVDDAVRVVLITSMPLRDGALVAELESLYRFGDAAEKRAVLRALPMLDVGPELTPLVLDALRTNDTRLVSAAVGPYARHLDAPAWRQAVLKCVFMGVPLSAVADLDSRADGELATMLTGLADERAAAGRTMPADALALLERLAERAT